MANTQNPLPPNPRQDLRGLEHRATRPSVRQVLTKPVTVVGGVLGLTVVFLIFFLEQDPSALRLEIPDVRYELLRNEGRSQGVPIAIRIGQMMVFQISDPIQGPQGAQRAKQVVETLTSALAELAENPPRVITIETGSAGGMPAVVQKEFEDSDTSLELVTVTEDDMLLVKADDSKLLARIWAERLTDTMRLLLFGQPPEHSRHTAFGAALDTLYVNAMNAEGGLTTAVLRTAFEDLPLELQRALTETPPAPPPELSEASRDSG